MEQQVQLVLGLDETLQGEMLYLDFVGVRDLRINQPEWSLIVISLLEIVESQILDCPQGVFAVADPEEGFISFLCRDFFVVAGS